MSVHDTDRLVVWDGVYPDFATAAGDMNAFESERWLDHVSEQARTAVQDAESDDFTTPASSTRDYVLPVFAALVAGNLKKRNNISILDVGGGMAASYFQVAASLPGGRDALDFHIVENEALCARAQEIVGSLPGLQFHSAMPERESFDIVHAGSSLHYIEDWQGALHRMADYRPDYLILADLPAGDIQTFASVQQYYGRRIPVWFWNISELLDAVANAGYRLIYRSRIVRPVRNVLGPKPMQNFNQRHRLDHDCQLVFIPDKDLNK